MNPIDLTLSPDWDQRFLDLAAHISTWSKDPRAQIGAVLTDGRNQIIASGFNGFPANLIDDMSFLSDPATKNDRMVHAEESAILTAGRKAKGSTLYVTGKPTCSRCAALIIQSGVAKVVAPVPRQGTTSKWERPGRLAIEMFKEAGLEVDLYRSD
jgi:dCMP deaminase